MNKQASKQIHKLATLVFDNTLIKVTKVGMGRGEAGGNL